MSRLEEAVQQALDETRTRPEVQQDIQEQLSQLQKVSEQDYNHSLRTGLLSRTIAQYLEVDERALLMAGLLHDIGKKSIRKELLGKTTQWTDYDKKEMEQHVQEGYEILKQRRAFTAEIILRHHHYQQQPYPETLPEQLHNYNPETRILINFYAKLLAIADAYDAFHRNNRRNGDAPLTEEEIRGRMLEEHEDQRALIEELYREGIIGRFEEEHSKSERKPATA